MNVIENEKGLTRRQFVGIAALGACALAKDGKAWATADPSAEALTDDTPLMLSWGLWWQKWAPDESFERLLLLLSRHRSVIDEVYLFDVPGTGWHSPLEACSQTADLMARRFEAFCRCSRPESRDGSIRNATTSSLAKSATPKLSPRLARRGIRCGRSARATPFISVTSSPSDIPRD